MADLVLALLGVEKAMRARRHGYHFLWAAGKTLAAARMAAVAGWLSW